MTKPQFKKVFQAIEAYHDEALGLVNWRAIL